MVWVIVIVEIELINQCITRELMEENINCLMKKRTKISHFYISSPDSFFLLQRPAEWERDKALPHGKPAPDGYKKRESKKPAAIDRIEKRKTQHNTPDLCYSTLPCLDKKKACPSK